jgi:hypothetical protein
MAEQGTGGGIDGGFIQKHERTNSEDQGPPTQAAVDGMSPPRKPDLQNMGLLPRTGASEATTTNFDPRQNPPSRSGSRERRKLEPPVTKATLSELDVTKIIHNPKLRHDINFDPELHFRPNMDGEKGRRKADKAKEFWSTLLGQLQAWAQNPVLFAERFAQEEWCLPLLLRAVKEIIQTLVPSKDRDVLDEGLNIDLLMQQFSHGTIDLEKLAFWLARVLKQHCAPMRDEWVDNMYSDLSEGNRNGSLDKIVDGMQSLLLVLEAMKLDVANHQIRCLRPVLIEDTVHFEQRFFHKKIQNGKLDIKQARDWFRAQKIGYDKMSDMDVFFRGLAQLIRPSNNISFPTNEPFAGREAIPKVPSTFVFDEERLLKYRSDMLDAINLEVCMRVFEDQERVLSITSSLPAYARPEFSMDFNFNTSPASSRPSSFVGSDTSSPRSSAVFSSTTFDFAEPKTKSRLYDSLVALLHTAPQASRPSQRWGQMVPVVAIEIYRFLNLDDASLVAGIETQLRRALDMSSDVYRTVEDQFAQRLLEKLLCYVKGFKSLSCIGLFSAVTGARGSNSSNSSRGAWAASRDAMIIDSDETTASKDGREEGGVDEMATRLAHLGILHWRVWAQLAYSDVEPGYVSANREAVSEWLAGA